MVVTYMDASTSQIQSESLPFSTALNCYSLTALPMAGHGDGYHLATATALGRTSWAWLVGQSWVWLVGVASGRGWWDRAGRG